MTGARSDQGGWGGADGPARPVERLLGPAALWAGPYSLLGIQPGPVDDNLILSALDRRLAQIGAHAERDSPEADETRLALHAAAAQLLDPSVRRHLEVRWRGARVPEPAQGAEPVPERPFPRRSAAEIALEHDAVVTLGLYGGWNQHALRRLTMLAHARGLSSQAVAITLQRLASPRAAPALRAAGGMGAAPSRRTMREQLNAPDADEVDPAPQIARRIAIVLAALGGSVVVSAIIVAFIISTLEPPEEPAPQPPPAVVAERESKEPPGTGGVPEPAPAPSADTMEADAAARAMRSLAGDSQLGYADSMRRFDEALAGLEAGWHELTPMRRVAATDSVVEFVYRAARWSGGAREAVERIGAPIERLAAGAPGAADVLPAVWSAGALSRLARELDVPTQAQGEVRRRLAQGLGPREATFERTFESGAAAAIGALADRLSAAPAEFWSGDEARGAWEAWRRAVEGLTGGDPALRERLILNGLETLLARGPEPNASEAAFGVVRDLTGALRWRADELARPTMLRWFDDRRMVSADLHAVTSTLARESSAEGVDITMVLPVLASERVRAELRARYASVWGLGSGVDREQAVAGWYEAAQRAVGESASAPGGAGTASAPERLARAVRLSRLSEAASWAWRGQIEAAALRVADLDGGLARTSGAQTQWPQLAQGYTVAPSAWAAEYLAAKRNIPLRLTRLDDALRASGRLPVVDAELIATEALLGQPAEVRRKAGEVALARRDSPSITHAVLELLAQAPATRHASELIEGLTATRLPPEDSDQWAVAARRALVERLLAQIASQGEHGRIDHLADLLAESYAGRTADRPDNIPGAVAADGDDLAAALWNRWRVSGARASMATSAPVSLPEIEMRRAGRLNLARSELEQFAAHQASILELMTLAVAIDRPDTAARLGEILEQASERRARAGHILEQIEVVEEAMVRVWMERLGRAGPGGAARPAETAEGARS